MLRDLPLWLHVALFTVSAAAIWLAGTRLERYAAVIAERTKLGQAFTGMLLLAAATSLPEVATTVTAVWVLDNPTLAVHNLLGGVALQTAILAIADGAKKRRGAMTAFRPRFVLLIEGVGLIMMLLLVIGGITVKGVPQVASTSTWVVALFAVWVLVMVLVYRARTRPRWQPTGEDAERSMKEDAGPEAESGRSTAALWLLFGALSGVVLGAGWLATVTAERLAEATGLGSAFLGATLLALATSLPEVSTTVSAARRDRYTMAMSNIFGSNAFDVGLLFVAELLYRKDSILAHAEPTVVFVSVIGAVMTCIYLWGLMEREDRTLLGIGWDSAAAVAVYLGGMTVLYFVQ